MKILRVFAWLFPSYLQMNVAAAVVGSSVVGGVMSSNAAGKAANAQQAGADAANATQLQMYNQTRQDNAPFRNTGVAANNQLATFLGITPDPYSTYGATRYDSNNPFTSSAASNEYKRLSAINGPEFALQQVIDGWNAQLNPVSDEQYAAYQAEQQANPDYGSLNRRFSMADLESDVPFQLTHEYAQKQGQTGVNRLASATGSLLSGATLKALQDRGANVANQYAGDARNRYVADQDSTYNRLAGLSGAGQQATAQVGAAGQNYANQVSSNQIGIGNARGASAIAGANTFNNALSQGVNAYQQQNYLNSLSSLNTGSLGYNTNGALSGQF